MAQKHKYKEVGPVGVVLMNIYCKERQQSISLALK